jgi:general secretion pathway protein G
MIQRLQKSTEVEEGFTLVELLVVIVILGILAAIVVFAVGGISDKGQNSASKTDVSVLQAAQEAYFAKQSPGIYTTESALASGGFLRGVSTYNYFCIQLTPAASVNADYYVLPAPIPATQALANTACSSAANVAAANKVAGTTWTGSAGTAAIP